MTTAVPALGRATRVRRSLAWYAPTVVVFVALIIVWELVVGALAVRAPLKFSRASSLRRLFRSDSENWITSSLARAAGGAAIVSARATCCVGSASASAARLV